ncbi:hypothetical protein L917_10564 [Phytophthora nicotianae]|uniref:Uncharacterized protein n=1 Tax=Phytophthora nicotianae TaxID=4792 RepID=W2L080_PHYNI|nr:hypothetical protein L917_10564 [Phytophthora nicotianae]
MVGAKVLMNMELKALELGLHRVGSSLSVCHVDSVMPGHEGVRELGKLENARIRRSALLRLGKTWPR